MMIPDHEHIVMTHTRWREATVERHEREAKREIDAAITLGHVDRSSPPLVWLDHYTQEDVDAWYEAVYGATEIELVEMVNAAANRYRSTRRWKRRARREALEAYIQARARLETAIGLVTVWR